MNDAEGPTAPRPLPTARWTDGELPANVKAGPSTLLTGSFAFKRLRSHRPDAITLGANCTMDGVQFAVGEAGAIHVGDYCYFTNAVLLCEQELRIGSYVIIGWNATIADTDFHPLAPAERVVDAVACSPLGAGRPRPKIECRPVVIEDDVWIGPNATILKGVTVGSGAFVEPGAVVTRNVPSGARVLGNPARVVEKTRPNG